MCKLFTKRGESSERDVCVCVNGKVLVLVNVVFDLHLLQPEIRETSQNIFLIWGKQKNNQFCSIPSFSRE